MPEPITIIVGGVAVYAWLKSRDLTPAVLPPAQQQAALAQAPTTITEGGQPLAVIPPGALMTNGSTVAAESGVPLGQALTSPVDTSALAVPSDLVAALDGDTALMFRAYAHLNPTDFEAFLDRYADRIVLRNDLMVERLTTPPEGGDVQVTPGMLVGMGTAAYRVAQALNGVAAGKSVDLFGVSASVAGQIPGINEDLVSSLQGLAMGYRAITGITQVMSIAAANGVSVLNFSAMAQVTTFGTGAAVYPGLAALPLAGVLMAVGLVVDIGFTIIGDKPDLQKAIDVALDVASLAVLFIPVIGIVIAIVIQLVKFIIDLFGEDLFGGGMSEEDKNILEAARWGEQVNPIYPELAAAYTPRELWRTLVEWGSGYCGGRHVVAMAFSLPFRAGDTMMVGGQFYTVPPELNGIMLGFGDNDQAGGCYWLQGTPFARMSNDEQAWALGVYASVNRVVARAQGGFYDWLKAQFEDPAENIVVTRTVPMREFLVTYRLTLDQVDQIALEYRAQPHLNELAAAFGWPTWQEHFASVVEPEWRAFNSSVAEGSLSDFARRNGYPTTYAFRAAALAPFEALWARVQTALAAARARQTMWESYEAQGVTFVGETAVYPSWSGSAP